MTTQSRVYPAHFDLTAVIRPNILSLKPYRCARDDYSEGILLDANENAYGCSIVDTDDAEGLSDDLKSTLTMDLHRYPDPSHPNIKARIASLRGLATETSGADHVFLGVGSDEIIDLLMRVCVKPGGSEKILTTPPTYGMYAVCAQVNDVGVVEVPLELGGEQGEGGEHGRFSAKIDEIKKTVAADPSIKLIFLCSPGNPTGTLIPLSSVRALLEFPEFKGIVVVDEAYIDFADDVNASSAASLVKQYANVCVMQTLSKSFGLAAIRLGILLAQPPLIQILSNTKAPYNISTPTAHLALSALSPSSVALMQRKVRTLIDARKELLESLKDMWPFGVGASIGGNDANFILVPLLDRAGSPDTQRAFKVYKALAETHGVVVRFRGNERGCTGCLRVTIGTQEENAEVLRKFTEVLPQIY